MEEIGGYKKLSTKNLKTKLKKIGANGDVLFWSRGLKFEETAKSIFLLVDFRK